MRQAQQLWVASATDTAAMNAAAASVSSTGAALARKRLCLATSSCAAGAARVTVILRPAARAGRPAPRRLDGGAGTRHSSRVLPRSAPRRPVRGCAPARPRAPRVNPLKPVACHPWAGRASPRHASTRRRPVLQGAAHPARAHGCRPPGRSPVSPAAGPAVPAAARALAVRAVQAGEAGRPAWSPGTRRPDRLRARSARHAPAWPCPGLRWPRVRRAARAAAVPGPARRLEWPFLRLQVLERSRPRLAARPGPTPRRARAGAALGPGPSASARRRARRRHRRPEQATPSPRVRHRPALPCRTAAAIARPRPPRVRRTRPAHRPGARPGCVAGGPVRPSKTEASQQPVRLRRHALLPPCGRPRGSRRPARPAGRTPTAPARGPRPARARRARADRVALAGSRGRLPGDGHRGIAIGQCGAQLVHGVAQARLHGLASNTGDVADLLQGEFLFEAQEHHFALVVGQGVELALQVAAALECILAQLGRVRVLDPEAALVCIDGSRWSVLPGAPMVGDAIARDPVQPGRERGVRTPVGTGRHHPLPGVLEDLVGHARVAQLAKQEAMQALAVARVECLERGNVAPAPGEHERVIAASGSIVGHGGGHAQEVKRCGWAREARARGCRGVHHVHRGRIGGPRLLAARGGFRRSPHGTDFGKGTRRVQAMLDIPVMAPPREIDLAGLAGMLAQSLPTGSDVVVCWDDERLGTGSSEVDGVSEALRTRARDLMSGTRDRGPAGDTRIDESWTEGEARVAIAARLPEPLTPGSREAWRALARRLVSATIASAQAEGRIDSLRKSERLQQALYEIADLAGSGLEMKEMLKRIHGVVGGLMSAANFYIVLYDDVRGTMRFLYFADRLDPWVAQPDTATPVAAMPNSLTVALLRYGQPLRGPSELIRERLAVELDGAHGPDAADWLGVPMRREGRVSGAIVVQSYDQPDCYTDE